MPSAGAVLEKLRSKAKPGQLEGMARFAIVGEGRLEKYGDVPLGTTLS